MVIHAFNITLLDIFQALAGDASSFTAPSSPFVSFYCDSASNKCRNGITNGMEPVGGFR